MVLEKTLVSPLYNKEIKPVNLKGNQPVTPADSAEASIEALRVERTNAVTSKVPDHGSSKKIVCSLTHGEAQKSRRLRVPMDTCIAFSPAALEAKQGAFWALEERDGLEIHWGHHSPSRTGKDRAGLCGRELMTGVWEQEGTSSA